MLYFVLFFNANGVFSQMRDTIKTFGLFKDYQTNKNEKIPYCYFAYFNEETSVKLHIIKKIFTSIKKKFRRTVPENVLRVTKKIILWLYVLCYVKCTQVF